MNKNRFFLTTFSRVLKCTHTQQYQASRCSQKLKLLYCMLIASCFVYTAHGQDYFRNGYCGTWTKPGGSSGEKIDYYDRFGNAFAEEELLRSAFNLEDVTVQECDNTGVFNPCYVGTWTDMEQATVCQVLGDLSQLIAPGQGGMFINILISKETLDFGVLGVGTPEYAAVDCGITNSTMISVLHGGADNYPAGFLHGTIRISNAYFWHTFDEGLPVDAGEYDLYSVALHEMLHVLGFASRITEDGTAISGDIYSRWDSYLYSGVDNEFLLENIEDGACCDAQQFNAAVDISSGAFGGSCADMVGFRADGMDIAIVADATNGGSNMLNRLSHLDISCNNNVEQVMHPGFGVTEHRRVLSAEEVAILCELGYGGAANGCNIYANCITITNDDEGFFYFLSEGNTASISGFDVLVNDLATGSVNFSVLEDCGSDLLGVVWDAANFEFDLTFNGLGTLSFCYQIEGCDGYCDEATVTIEVLPEPVPTICIGDQGCNLVCFGDFEDFVPEGSNNYFPSLGITSFMMNIADNGDTDIRENSPNVSIDTEGNQFLHLFYNDNCGDCDFEGVYLPLSAAIEPGCTASVSFDALNELSSGVGVPTLKFFALTGPPCDVFDYPYGCTDTPFNLCSGVTASCMTFQDFPAEAEWIPIASGMVNNPGVFDPIDFQPYSFNWVNNTGQPITHILLVSGNAAGTGFDNAIHNYIDNISITTDCQIQTEITLTSIETTACMGEVLDTDLQVCLQGDGTMAQDVSIIVGSLPLGFAIVGGDFDAAGVANLLMAPGDCSTLNLRLDVPASYVGGTTLFIPVQATVEEGFCVLGEGGESEMMLTMENCAPIPPGFTCPCTNGINIDATGGLTITDLVADGILPAGQLNNTCLAIAGTLIVDENYTIDGGEIFMQPGSSIRLPDADNATLTLTNINQNEGIHACEEMWRGIRVESGCTLDMNNCRVEDAQHAVTAGNLSKIALRSNEFNRNYISVFIPEDDVITQQVNNTIRANTFTSDGADLLPPFDTNLDPAPTDVTYAGILLNDLAQFTVGGGIGNANTFRGIQQGILANDVDDLRVWSNSFEDITFGDFYPWNHHAIRATVTDLTVSGASFTNCEHSIYANYPLGLEVKSNVMMDVGTGLYSQDSRLNDVVVQNNIITNASLAIWIRNDFPGSVLDIQDNIIGITPDYFPQTSGISVANFLNFNTSGDTRVISNNTLNSTGIGIVNNPGTEIINNTITCDIYCNGITAFSSPSTIIEDNHLTDLLEYEGNNGIHVVSSPDMQVSCNDITGYRFPLGFLQDCSCLGSACTEVKGNTLEHVGPSSYRGLFMLNSIISDQVRTGNAWLGVTSTSPNGVWDAYYQGPALFLNQSRFIVPTGVSPDRPQHIQVDFGMGVLGDENDWFSIEEGPVEDCEGEGPNPVTPEHDAINHLLVQDNVYPDDPGSDWIGKRHLYTNLKQDASLVTSSTLQSFLDENVATPLGVFYNLENLLKTALAEKAVEIKAFKNTIDLVTDELYNLNVAYFEEGGASQEQQIRNQYQLLNFYKDYYNSLLAQRDAGFKSSLETGMLWMNALSATTVPEANLKTSYQVLLNMWYEDRNILTGTEIAVLRNIASQCISEGGDGVILARALLDELSEGDENCGFSAQAMPGLPHAEQNLEGEQIRVNVFPNPAETSFTVLVSGNESDEPLALELYSTSGHRLLHEYLQANGKREIPLTGLSSGMYFYRITTGGKPLQQGKLVKQ